MRYGYDRRAAWIQSARLLGARMCVQWTSNRFQTALNPNTRWQSA